MHRERVTLFLASAQKVMHIDVEHVYQHRSHLENSNDIQKVLQISSQAMTHGTKLHVYVNSHFTPNPQNI